MKTNTKDKAAPQSKELTQIKLQIAKAEEALKALRQRKRDIEAAEDSKRRKAEDDVKREFYLKILQVFASGKTVKQAAKELGTTTNIRHHIGRAWWVLFPKHYDANYKNIREKGSLQALRDSPPIFPSSHPKMAKGIQK